MAAHLNAIGTAVPAHEVHGRFVDFAPSLLADPKARRLFARMAERAGIEQRWSCLQPAAGNDRVDVEGFYQRGRFPSTKARMQRFEAAALPLAEAALASLAMRAGPDWRHGLTHLIVTCCTGFFAPSLDQQLIERFRLPRGVERTLVGFMGCNAAFNALKLARHVVRSDPGARVLMVNLELCTLHLQETDDLEQALLFLLFADGCAASLVTAEPTGFELGRFASALVPGSDQAITWRIGDDGFDMRLSGAVPKLIGQELPVHVAELLAQEPQAAVDCWAVHPGGRSILDAVETSLGLAATALKESRDVLRRFGNMSSATIMFVLEQLLAAGGSPGQRGVALGFGPGLGLESFTFKAVGP